jgi:hypothetical protein
MANLSAPLHVDAVISRFVASVKIDSDGTKVVYPMPASKVRCKS